MEEETCRKSVSISIHNKEAMKDSKLLRLLIIDRDFFFDKSSILIDFASIYLRNQVSRHHRSTQFVEQELVSDKIMVNKRSKKI